MKVLAFDQSTRVTGYAVFSNGEYSDSGVIDLSKNKNTSERSRFMGLEIFKIIESVNPDVIIIEEVQQQSNADTLKKLARLQGVIIGYAAANNITLYIVGPSTWRKTLGYKQGSKIKRAELKQQSFDYVKTHFGFDDFIEDRCEAICICEASHKIFNLPPYDEVWGEQE